MNFHCGQTPLGHDDLLYHTSSTYGKYADDTDEYPAEDMV